MAVDEFSFKAVGVSFHPDYPENLLRLRETLGLAGGAGEASLIREPDNEHDPNAVAIFVGGTVVGHAPRAVAQFVGPMLDDGTLVRATATVLIDPDHEDRPGLLVECERVT